MIGSTQAMMKTCQEEILVPATADNSAEVKVFVHRPKRLQGPRYSKCKKFRRAFFLDLNMHNNVKEISLVPPWCTFTEEASLLDGLTSFLGGVGPRPRPKVKGRLLPRTLF